ncbi:hypothetical protein Dform_00069 [Dehalogenimonas formicexedens]|uniref:Uncharacterized protein n=1 Tax=Dehalogenimonas formicexedens TaxID=1839801 RepID=A0A1P8F4N1_9CHLR|nr:hypothetical protein [Dehalogenimonas formicexedens]APV43434.1 hypothetical protein Dform_00069 [Dehalogenimonas formicexedens]
MSTKRRFIPRRGEPWETDYPPVREVKALTPCPWFRVIKNVVEVKTCFGKINDAIEADIFKLRSKH